MLDEFPDPKQKHFCWISIQFGGFNYIYLYLLSLPICFKPTSPLTHPQEVKPPTSMEIWRKTNRPLCACATLRCVSLGNYGAPATKPVRLVGL